MNLRDISELVLEITQVILWAIMLYSMVALTRRKRK